MFVFIQRIFLAFVFLGLFLSVGCGLASNSDDSESDTKLDGVSYTVLADTSLTQAETFVSGNGTIIFNAPLSSIAAKNSVLLSFSLEDGGSLTLSMFSTTSLTNGVEYRFSRSGSTLHASLHAEDEPADISFMMDDFSATGNIELAIDMHNDEVPAHTLVWTGADFSEEAALFNSEEDEETPGNGVGTFWGLVLNKATVETASLGDPHFVE